jgi:hypothetical protein
MQTCKSGKKVFTKKEAATTLNYNAVSKIDRQRRKECRYYQCPLCNMWHLTSLDKGGTIRGFVPSEEFKKFLQ